METLLIEFATKLALAFGEDAAKLIVAFLQGFVELREKRGEQTLLLPTLLGYWFIAADHQVTSDGKPLDNDAKKAYVKNIMEVWAHGVGLDLRDSFKEALIKTAFLQRVMESGQAIVFETIEKK